MATEGCIVLPLLDNAFSHRATDASTDIAVHVLPPNTTSHMQSHDVGIIQAIKSQLIKRPNALIVDELDSMIQRDESEEECRGVRALQSHSPPGDATG